MAGSYRSPAREIVTAQMARERLIYDPETGDFWWRISPGRNRKAGDRAWSMSRGRKTVRLGGARHPASSVAWLYVRGEWPATEIDHRDRDKSNDAFNNLREATPQKNCMNQGARVNSSTGYRGVSPVPGKSYFQCRISADGHRYNLGLYPSAEFAAAAYRIAAAGMHGDFAGDGNGGS
jgi:hypothetical protein